MHLLELGLMPLIALIASLTIPLLYKITKKRSLTDYVAIAFSTIIFMFAIKIHYTVSREGVVIYKFGGFPPPLGVFYVVDGVSSILALVACFTLFIAIPYSTWIYRRDDKHVLYSLLFILTMGVTGCLYTGDLFNFYVSIELVAVTCYALTALYSDHKRAVRAAFIYGVFGTVMTSTYFLSVMMIYGSYGTLNVVDIMVKVNNPGAITPFSGEIYADPMITSKIAIVLITWVLIFKSGIIPNHFWLPEVYRSATLPAVLFFTASADLLGIYGLTRLYFTVFTGDSIIAEFRSLMISILVIISSFSAIVASTIVMRQKTIRGLVAYSSIVQFSLALLGITSETVEGISGGILHLVVNALGDTLVLISAGSIIHSPTILREKTGQMLVYICTIVGLLNLFGVIPILPGFWSKAFLTLGFVKADMTFGAATVLISSGLCAIGYFKIIIALVSMKPLEESENVTREAKNAIPKVLMTIVLALVIAFGLSILMIGQVRSYLLGIGTRALDRSRLINFLYSNTN